MQDKYKYVDLIKTYHSRNIHGLGIAALALLGLATAPPVMAQSYTLNTLASFSSTDGQNPFAGLTLSGNTLYGTTSGGGAYGYFGTVFSVPITGGMPTVLASFRGINGIDPEAGLTLSGSTLYGTTFNGGAYGYGTVFSVPKKGGKITVLASFKGKNGTNPYASLVLKGCTLYGTTQYGGANYMPNAGQNGWGNGTVFSVPTKGGNVTVLATFKGADGRCPAGNLILIGSSLYGTTFKGGVYNAGTVFSVPLKGGIPTVLASFNGTNGNGPLAGLTLSGSALYGTTTGDGDNNNGTVFSVPVSGGKITVLTTFNVTNGAIPKAGLALGGTTLYGTTYGGIVNTYGTVFSVQTTGDKITATK